MSTWTDESKAAVVKAYQEKNPTSANSTEIVKELAETFNQTANSVRMVLMQEKVYVKKEGGTAASAASDKKGTAGSGTAGKKPSKEALQAELTKAIENAGHVADQDIIGKLTGKAAEYLTKIIAGSAEADTE
jgi:hypothetical protein